MGVREHEGRAICCCCRRPRVCRKYDPEVVRQCIAKYPTPSRKRLNNRLCRECQPQPPRVYSGPLTTCYVCRQQAPAFVTQPRCVSIIVNAISPDYQYVLGDTVCELCHRSHRRKHVKEGYAACAHCRHIRLVAFMTPTTLGRYMQQLQPDHTYVYRTGDGLCNACRRSQNKTCVRCCSVTRCNLPVVVPLVVQFMQRTDPSYVYDVRDSMCRKCVYNV